MTLNLNLSNDGTPPEQLSPLTLAFLGDTVYDLFVREMLIKQANRPARELHRLAAKRVCAQAQADGVKYIWESGALTEEEVSLLKRGRNAHTSHIPKHATQESYHLATGFETLFGYIYLKGDGQRLQEVFALMCNAFDIEEKG